MGIKRAYQKINISKSDRHINNFRNQFIGLDFHKWTNKDTVYLIILVVEFKEVFESKKAAILNLFEYVHTFYNSK